MNPFVVAVLAGLVTLVPGYLVGRLVRGRPRIYKVVFYGTLALMVAAVSWALMAGNNQGVALALGVGFGLVNGARHGFSPVFEPLLKHGRDESDDT